MEQKTASVPKISIILPIYNVERYLHACFESVLNQSFSDFEVIAVNDGSTDKSPEIARAYAAKDSRIRYLETENRGVSLARETALGECRADYVCFLDSDDTWNRNILEELYRKITSPRGPFDIAVCNYIRIRPGYAAPHREKIRQPLKDWDFFYAVAGHGIFPSLCVKLYRRTLFGRIRSYPFPIGEDTLINLQIGLEKPRVAFCDYMGYNYMQRPGSGVRTPVGLEYAENYCHTVDKLIRERDILTADQKDFAKALYYNWWYFAYISKSHNPWRGDSRFAQECRKLFIRHRKALRKYYSRGQGCMIRLDAKKSLRPLVKLISTGRRIKTSLLRRISAKAG